MTVENIQIKQGKTSTVLNGTASASKTIVVESDSILVTLWADTVGTSIDLVVYAVGEDGDESTLLTFSQLTSATTELVQMRADQCTSKVRVAATCVGTCDYYVQIRGVSRALDSDVDSMTVVATDLDIRDLDSANDSVTVTGSVNATCTATNLDIRDLDKTTDSVSAEISNTVTVDATDLDIRDLNSTDDSVEIGALASGISTNSNSQLKVTVYRSDGTEGLLDAASGALVGIDRGHAKIHEGSHYYVANFETIADGDSVDFAVTVPDTEVWPHMLFIIEGTSRTEMRIYEGSAVTGGTTVTPVNNNRNSANTSDMTLAKNPTVNTLGTLIFAQSKGLEGTTPSKANNEGILDREAEMILKRDTTYIFRITSRDDGNIVSYIGEWYEHSDLN